ncbi:MAG: DEAD/DEAH box helicase [Roseiflexaceae bacterium]|nr:DEAD/DEAH box helicase [Roseiflexaceae bacterium]
MCVKSSNNAGNGAHQYFKCCPGIVEQAQTLVLRRDAGIELPPLAYGAEIIVEGAKVKKVSETHIEIEPNAETRIRLCSPEKRTIETFSEETSPEKTSPQETFLEETFLKVYSERTRMAIDEIGYRLFGFPQMHAFQHRILAHVLTGRSILGIAATGGGKSECYILPAMLLPGITIVVSPLKSLMADQYEQRICQRYGLGNLSTFINGDVPFQERQRRLRHIELGHYKLVYVTPEQLERSYVLNSLKQAHKNVGIRYLALDEAHCISQWGHDFRPSYLNIVHRLRARGLHPVRIALTATASPDVRQDLCEELELNPASLDQGGDVYIKSSNRPELNLIVRVCRTTAEKVDAILSDLRRLQEMNRDNPEPGAAIVFLPWTGGRPGDGASEQPAPKSALNQNGERQDEDAATRESQCGQFSAGVTRFASYLERTLGERVAIYHSKMDGDDPAEEANRDAPDNHQTGENRPLGDMSGRTRSQQQNAFITGKCNIMVATKGFGMGIDKPNVRLVIHRTPPANLEAYAQEAGRAGRDRQLADVILYYSPDEAEDIEESGKTTKVPSDRQIQERFLSEKHIRREDVIVMRAFLRSVTRRVADRLYFTNDEAIEFFDKCVDNPIAELEQGYRWPTWPERVPSGYELPEHQAILDRGYEYQKKTDYIKRILDVLYRIRPATDAHTREALILELRQCGGTIIKPQVYNVNAIFRSNAYFGDVLRKSGITPQEFTQLYMAGDLDKDGDLIPLAERLAMPLSDLEQMIHDIRQFDRVRDQQTGKWRPALLDGQVKAPWYGPAAGRTSLKAWRDYAGAWKRASDAYERAKKANPSKPSIDDWFGWSEVCSRYGWEVLGGPALEREDDFADYLERFMEVHERRRANDWASYNRLLTDYVGVREDGSIGDAAGKECLRAVLLGYLKTYEVVVGGNCYSCSRCVPDGNFAAFDMEQRRHAVARMTEELERLFTQAESFKDRLPDERAIDRLFDAIRQAQASGSSLGAYLQGWTARLLQDAPNHQAALLIRITAMLEGLFEPQRRDLLNMLQTLVDVAAVEESERIDRLMSRAREHLSDSDEFHRLRATIARRLNNPQEEVRAWTDVVRILEQSKHTPRRKLYDAHRELMRLYAPESPLHDHTRYNEHARHAARRSPNIPGARAIYSSVAPQWEWQFIVDELEYLTSDAGDDARAQALLHSWLAARPDERAAVVATWLSEKPSLWQTWPVEAIEPIIRLFPELLLREHPRIPLHVAQQSGNLDDMVQWSQVIVERNEALADDALERIALAAADGHEQARRLIDQLRSDPDRAEATYQVMKPVIITKGWNRAAWFVERFAERIAADEPAARLDILERCINSITNNVERSDALQRLEQIAQSLFDCPETAAQARSVWHRLYIEQPQAAISYLTECQSDQRTASYAIDCLQTLRTMHKPTVNAIYALLKPRFVQKTRTLQGMMLWCEWFEAEILANSSEDRLDVFKRSLALAYQMPDRAKFYKTLAPIAVSLLLDRNVQFREIYGFLRKCAIDYPEICDQMYDRFKAQLSGCTWETVEAWLAIFQARILQESSGDLISLLRRWQTLLPRTPARRAALRRLLPLVQKLLSDAAYTRKASKLWGEICSDYPIYVPGDRVWHPSFGLGRVIATSVLESTQTPLISVEFDQAGTMEFSLHRVGIGIVELAQEPTPVT